MQKVLYVTIIGAPNVGKSSLVNILTNNHSCIVSSKGHTTKDPVYAVLNHTETNGDVTQIIFVDTPGFSRENKGKYGRYNSYVLTESNLKEASVPNVLMFLVESHRPIAPQIENLLDRYNDRYKMVVFTKTDKKHHNMYLETTDQIKDKVNEVFLTSVITGKGINMLLNHLIGLAVPHPHIYPADFICNVLPNHLIENAIREALFENLYAEIPHEAVIEYEVLPNDIYAVDISCTASQKNIILANIKPISIQIRENISAVLKRPIHIRLNIKTIKH